jgi:hypothetical protein
MKPYPFDRRQVIKVAVGALAATALPRSLCGQSAVKKASFSFGNNPLCTVPLDFNGLSDESPQLVNPAFFSSGTKELVDIYCELAPTGGVLRTGGNLSAFTGWRDDPSIPLTSAEQVVIDRGKKYWEWDLTDPSIRQGNHETIVTPTSIESLAGFLDATGWKLLYGLNFGAGTQEQAASEAACVQRLVGKNLLGFQLGNEIDFWSGGLRSSPWDFDTYYAQWREWVRFIRAKVPDAPFAGPDVAIRLDWMEQLAANEKRNVTVLTGRHYAMGPGGDARMNAVRLLGPDSDVAKEIASAQRAKAVAGVGFRTAECGSCFHGGQPGVSDSFASALWGADYMLTLAQGGHAGINMHGGGEGFYSPITGDRSKGFTRQPLYYGMKLAQQFAGATMLESSLAAGSANITAFAATKSNGLLLAVINKGGEPLDLEIKRSSLRNMQLRSEAKLCALAIDSRSGIVFASVAVEQPLQPGKDDIASLAPYSALVLQYSRTSIQTRRHSFIRMGG